MSWQKPVMHIPYESKLGHPSDFRVKYIFNDSRQKLPSQGYRSDFWYYREDAQSPNSIYMIWPEFENSEGDLVTDTSAEISREGTARMWIIMPKMRAFHKEKIVLGLKGYIREGSRTVAECEVIEITGLLTNPTS